MLRAASLVSLLVLGWTWSIQGLPVLPDPLYPTQENFDLDRFLGTWHDIAKASTCNHAPHQREESAIGKLVLQKGTTEGKIKMTRTVLRQRTCKAISGEYELTTTPGRFFFHVAKWGADVDAYVVHTNYDEYAIVIMSKQKSAGQSSTSIKLYSRTMDVRATILDDFKTLVRQQGMSDNTIVIKQNKGDCVPGEREAEPTTPVQPQRVRRASVLTEILTEDGGSGYEPFFNGSEACSATPDTGPCFGLHPRFYYNASSMSCENFNYGGCMGNQNNFHTERECLQRCRTEAVCHLPMAAEPCKGQPPIWAFDSTSGLCVPYKQDFCQTNGNKFYSKNECEEYCGVEKDEELLGAV
ncbi:protein AMBP [Aulostomus maculatus]